MKRLCISIALLITVIAGGVWSSYYIRQADMRIQQLGSQIREKALCGEGAAEDIDALCTLWEKHCRVLAFIENTNSIADISGEMSRLPALADADPPELVRQIDVICALCDLLSERQQPHLRSVL